MKEIIQKPKHTLSVTDQRIVERRPVGFDRLIERRNALVGTELEHLIIPNYWLLPEVNRVIEAAREFEADAPPFYRRLLMNTLWRTGGRITEVLNIRPMDITDAGDHHYITLHTLKKRAKNGTPSRAIELANDTYLSNLMGYIEGANIKPKERIFKITARTSNYWIKKAATIAGLDANAASNHTFRHSFAMNYLLQADLTRGNSLVALQQLMGHTSINSTMLYLKILSIDVHGGTGSMQW